MEDDFFEKELKENRRYTFIFLGIFFFMLITSFCFFLSRAISDHNSSAIVGTVISGFFIVFISGIFVFCLYKGKKK